jgi:hypothetical protein
MDEGYPMAFADMAYALQQGDGIAKDEANVEPSDSLLLGTCCAPPCWKWGRTR